MEGVSFNLLRTPMTQGLNNSSVSRFNFLFTSALSQTCAHIVLLGQRNRGVLSLRIIFHAEGCMSRSEKKVFNDYRRVSSTPA